VSLPTADNWRVARARAAAVLGGSDIELIMIDMQTTKRDDYLAKFSAGCVPAFEATDGTIIQQSGAIATYGECRVVRLIDFDLLLPTFPLFRIRNWPLPGVCFL
jgi:glutathione S-transferase